MRSLWLLHEMQIEFKLHEIEFSMAALRTPEYLGISPLGRVPCLRDNECTIFESGAICQYLCENYDNENLYRAPGHSERIQWLQWIHFAETIAVHGASLVQQKVFIAPEKRSEVVQKLESRRLFIALEILEPVLAEHDYLLQSGFSAADTGVGYSIHLAQQFIDIKPLENVQRYYDRISKRKAFKLAL